MEALNELNGVMMLLRQPGPIEIAAAAGEPWRYAFCLLAPARFCNAAAVLLGAVRPPDDYGPPPDQSWSQVLAPGSA